MTSYDYDDYSKKRDAEIEKILSINKLYNRFILNPNEHLKKDHTPYKVFTPFFKSLTVLTSSSNIEEFTLNKKIKKIDFNYEKIPTLKDLGFIQQKPPLYLKKSIKTILKEFVQKLPLYKENRDYFYKDATSKLSVHLRFGLISPREIFNFMQKHNSSDFFYKGTFLEGILCIYIVPLPSH